MSLSKRNSLPEEHSQAEVPYSKCDKKYHIRRTEEGGLHHCVDHNLRILCSQDSASPSEGSPLSPDNQIIHL